MFDSAQQFDPFTQLICIVSKSGFWCFAPLLMLFEMIEGDAKSKKKKKQFSQAFA